MSPTVREHPGPVRHAPFGDQEANHPRKQKRPDIIQAFSTLFARNKHTPPPPTYSTVTDFARFRGLSTSVPLTNAAW